MAFSYKTVASSEWARLRAHNRRYDAVFEIMPIDSTWVSR